MTKIHYWICLIICISATSCITDQEAFDISDTEWVSIDGARIVFNADSTFYADKLNILYVIGFNYDHINSVEKYDSVASQIPTSFKGIWWVDDDDDFGPDLLLHPINRRAPSFNLRFFTMFGHEVLGMYIGDPDLWDVYKFYNIKEFTP